MQPLLMEATELWVIEVVEVKYGDDACRETWVVQSDGLEDVLVWRRPLLLLLQRGEQPERLEAALVLEVAQVKQMVGPRLE